MKIIDLINPVLENFCPCMLSKIESFFEHKLKTSQEIHSANNFLTTTALVSISKIVLTIFVS